jgi:tetratricopeptide (TPR) repeat protein
VNESSQQRLDEFRAGYRHATTRVRLVPWLLGLVVLLVLAGVAVAVRGTSGHPGLQPDAQRQLAAYLAEKRAHTAALQAYDAYLAQATLAPEERAKVCLAAAKVAIEAGAYERALALLYEAEWLKPGQDLQREIDAKILTCLEQLGRGADLRNELRARAQIGRDRQELVSGDVVLAELADRVITERDLEQALEKLPPPARHALGDPAKKAEFLKTMVADHLLAEKARRRQLDKDPQIQAMLSEQLNTLMVRKLLEEEVQSKIHITPAEIERYYKAEQARFTAPASASVKLGQRVAGAASPVFNDSPITIRQGQSPGAVAGGEAAIAAIFALEPGEQTQAFTTPDGTEIYYEIVSKAPARTPPLEDIRPQVERDLRQKRELEQFQTVIQSLLQTHNVRLYPERLQETEW